MIKRDGVLPTGMRFELYFAKAGIPCCPFQMRHEQPANAAAPPTWIGHEPVNDGGSHVGPFANRQSDTTEKLLCRFRLKCYPRATVAIPRTTYDLGEKIAL